MLQERSQSSAVASYLKAPAPGYGAPRRLELADARADGRQRIVLLARDRVEIGRSVAGVFMHIALKASDYRGVALRLRVKADQGFGYEVTLVHADPDLSVTLAEAEDDHEIQADWRLWARFLRLPALVERQQGCDAPERAMLGGVVANAVGPRRRGKAMTSRRARFLVRRKLGNPALATLLCAERAAVLFSGSKRDR